MDHGGEDAKNRGLVANHMIVRGHRSMVMARIGGHAVPMIAVVMTAVMMIAGEVVCRRVIVVRTDPDVSEPCAAGRQHHHEG